MGEIILGIVLLVIFCWILWQVFNILDFFKEVPKQLKRIADALENRN